METSLTGRVYGLRRNNPRPGIHSVAIWVGGKVVRFPIDASDDWQLGEDVIVTARRANE